MCMYVYVRIYVYVCVCVCVIVDLVYCVIKKTNLHLSDMWKGLSIFLPREKDNHQLILH